MKCVVKNNSSMDMGPLLPLLKSLLPYTRKKLGFNRPPSLFFASDAENASKPLGKTAFYDPAEASITVFVDGRHPKDILRSISHELVHHMQHERGDFGSDMATGEGYAQENEGLRELEREAYESGNMSFRDWEDENRQALQEAKQHFDRKNKKMNLKEAKKHNRRLHLEQIVREELKSSINEAVGDWWKKVLNKGPEEAPKVPQEAPTAQFMSADEVRENIRTALAEKDRAKLLSAANTLYSGRLAGADGYEGVFDELIEGSVVPGQSLPQRDIAIFSMLRGDGRKRLQAKHGDNWSFIVRATDKDGFIFSSVDDFRALEQAAPNSSQKRLLSGLSKRYGEYKKAVSTYSSQEVGRELESLGFEYDPETNSVRLQRQEADIGFGGLLGPWTFSNEAQTHMSTYEARKKEALGSIKRKDYKTDDEFSSAQRKAQESFDKQFIDEMPAEERENIMGSPLFDTFEVDDPFYLSTLSKMFRFWKEDEGPLDAIYNKSKDLRISEHTNELLKNRYDELVAEKQIKNAERYTFDDFRGAYFEVVENSRKGDNERAMELYKIMQGGLEHLITKVGKMPQVGKEGEPVYSPGGVETVAHTPDRMSGWSINDAGTVFGELFYHPDYRGLVMPKDVDPESMLMLARKKEIFDNLHSQGKLQTSEDLKAFADSLAEVDAQRDTLVVAKNVDRDISAAVENAIAYQDNIPDGPAQFSEIDPMEKEMLIQLGILDDERAPIIGDQEPYSRENPWDIPGIQESILNEALLRKVVQEALIRRFGE